MKYIPKEKQNTTEWSGGTTTELYLYPADGSYKERDFLLRLSTALCKDETSVFTKLQDTKRILMVLEGEVTLSHDGKRSVRLCPGEQDTFSGEEETISHGICRDFNLMLKGTAGGSLEYVSLGTSETRTLSLKADGVGIYLLSGSGSVWYGTECQIMQEEDFLLLGMDDSEIVGNEEKKVTITAEKQCVFVITAICLNLK